MMSVATTLDPNPALDEAVCRRVFPEWGQPGDGGGFPRWVTNRRALDAPVESITLFRTYEVGGTFSPSSDLNAAGHILSKLRRLGHHVSMNLNGACWVVCITGTRYGSKLPPLPNYKPVPGACFGGEDEYLAPAICKAALQWAAAAYAAPSVPNPSVESLALIKR